MTSTATPAAPTPPTSFWRRASHMASSLLLQRDDGQAWPGAPVSDPRAQILLTSFLVLVVELTCIRWLPSAIRNLGFFANFVLLATMLGSGIGLLTARNRSLAVFSFPAALAFLALMVLSNRWEVQITSANLLYYGDYNTEGRQTLILLPVLFLLVTAVFVPLGRALGRLLPSLPPLQAYTWDILGSLGGIAFFFLIAVLSLPPLVWFGAILITLLLLVPGRRWAVTVVLLAVPMAVSTYLSLGAYWSPYYKITLQRDPDGSLMLNVNNLGHQRISVTSEKEPFYFVPYQLFKGADFKEALIIGAGNGSDVAAALANGVGRIDAVEIDPTIAQIGAKYNPEHPFDDQRVTVHINDGRAFLNNAQRKYDLIIFALADSLTLTSGMNNIRLESFLLTEEAMAEAKKHLTDDGVLVVYNYYRTDWLLKKKAGIIEDAFGSPPYAVTYGGEGRAAVFLAGPKLAKLDPATAVPYSETPVPPGGESLRLKDLPKVGSGILKADATTVAPATDDWPFLYLETRTIPDLYIAALAFVVVVALVLMRWAGSTSGFRSVDGHFFFLGAAFLLLETKSLVEFGLLFGTTWMVNTLVFFAILLGVLLAIGINAKFQIRRTNWLYAALALALVVAYLAPPSTFLSVEPAGLRYVLTAAFVFLPILIANVVFSSSFKDTDAADNAFGSNLLGLMFGGVLEYVSLLTGYRALSLVVLLLYAIAFFLHRRARIALPAPSGVKG